MQRSRNAAFTSTPAGVTDLLPDQAIALKPGPDVQDTQHWHIHHFPVVGESLSTIRWFSGAAIPAAGIQAGRAASQQGANDERWLAGYSCLSPLVPSSCLSSTAITEY